MNLVLKEKNEIAPQIFVFKFTPEKSLVWQAGQFIFYDLPHPHPDSRGTTRHFTIADAPYEKTVYLATRILPEKGSSFKTTLKNLPVGSKIEAHDISGSFTVSSNEKNLVFIAGGIGITPFRAIILDLAFKNRIKNITLLYSNRDQKIPFKDELDKVAIKNPGLKIHYVIEPNRIDETLLKNYIDNNTDYFVSGPPPMVTAVAESLKTLNIDLAKIHQDSFTGYD